MVARPLEHLPVLENAFDTTLPWSGSTSDFKVVFSHGSPVGARVVERRGEGLYGRPPSLHLPLSVIGQDELTDTGHTCPPDGSHKGPLHPYAYEAPATFTSPAGASQGFRAVTTSIDIISHFPPIAVCFSILTRSAALLQTYTWECHV